MSANLVVDIGATCDYRASVTVSSGSNLIVGQIVDLTNANTYCNVFCAGGIGSGEIVLRIQTSDAVTSGTFTDPTSGIALLDLPPSITSGGQIHVNSGLWASGNSSLTSPVNSAPLFCSGGIQFAAFQRPHQYARLILVSGPFLNSITAGFVSNKRQTGSGGGFTYSPGSGTVDV